MRILPNGLKGLLLAVMLGKQVIPGLHYSFNSGSDVFLDSHVQFWFDIVHDGHLEALQKGRWQLGTDPHW
jgi:hypothetical protein